MMQLKAKDLSGCMVALVTPMQADGQIDWAQWDHLLQTHIDCGTRALVVAGTTGESALLNDTEINQLTETAVAASQGHPTHVIVGTGHITADAVIQANRKAHTLGADAALVVTPYYLTLSQDALYQHFKTIADHSDLPLILYNVPSRTGMDLRSQTTARLAQLPQVIGIKEAKACMERIQKLVNVGDFAVLSGDDHSFVNAMKMGANGVISVAANVRPKSIQDLCNLAQLGDFSAAEQHNETLAGLYDLLFHEPNPCPVKSLMHATDLIGPGIRPPLQMSRLSQSQINSHQTKIRKEMKAE